MKYSGNKPPIERIPSPATFETPTNIYPTQEDINSKDNTTNVTEPDSKQIKMKSISWDQYLNTHTSQDNESFEDILEVTESKHREKYKYLYGIEGSTEENQQKIVALPSIEQQAALTQKPLNVDTWGCKNKNSLMYNLDGVELTKEQEMELMKNKHEINHKNTRLKINPLAKTPAKTEDLYKIHSGHRVFDDHSDRSNSSSDENSEIDIRDAQFRPPLYSYGDLITNLVEYYGTESNVECKLKALENGTGPEQIAHNLAEQITEDHCFICNASGTKHYRQAVHFKAVRSWIQNALADLKDPVDWTLLFCQVCNLPLSGNETALAHYYEPSHVENTSSFCTTCLRVIDAHNMANHCKTLKHEKNADSLNLPPVVECQKDDNLQRENGTGPTKTGLEQIAHKLAEQITEDHCFMCNASGTKHYRQAVHFKTVRSSIQEVLADLKEPVDWTLLFCQVCNLSLSGTETALAHYLEPSHVENASSFCPICVRVIDACNMVPHCMSRNHKNKAALNFPSTIKCGKDIALQVGGKAKNAIKIETYVPETVESNDIVMSASDVVIEPSQSQQGPTGKEGGDWSFEGVSEANMKSIEVEKYASETVVSAKSSIIQTSQSQLEDSLSKEIVEASIKPIAGEKHVLEATDIDVLANSTIIEPSQSELEATSEEDDNSLSMGISRFEKNIAQVLDERKTAFSSIQFSYLIMCIRNFRRLLQLQLKEGKTFKIRTAFEWSPSNFPGRISFVFMVDDYDIFHLMLNHESAQLCSFVKDQQCLTTTRSFRKFNEYLLIGLEECAAIGGPFGLIGEDDTMDASSVFDDYGDYVDDTGDVQHITTFFEKLLVIKEIVKTMRGIIIRICAPPSHTTYVYNSCQISKLITYMKNFSDFVQKNRDAFYIEDVFKNNKKPSCQAFGLQDFERCKNVVYRELDDLVRFALREQELCCEAVVSYFSQFTWKLLVMLQMDNMINEAISKLSTERNELHRQMALFKLTTGRILCNRQTPWVLAETRKFIMLIRNFQESIQNCQVFTPNRFRKPLMIGALKMASDYDIYKLILYQEMDKLCSLVSSQQRIPYSDKVNYFQNFNRELVLAIEDFDKGDLGLSDSDDSEDDDSSFYSACVCSCPKFCVSNT